MSQMSTESSSIAVQNTETSKIIDTLIVEVLPDRQVYQ